MERMVMFRRLDRKADWDHVCCCVFVLPPVCTKMMSWRILSFDDVLPTIGKLLRCALVDGQPGPAAGAMKQRLSWVGGSKGQRT